MEEAIVIELLREDILTIAERVGVELSDDEVSEVLGRVSSGFLDPGRVSGIR